jgi:hypothetical protein
LLYLLVLLKIFSNKLLFYLWLCVNFTYAPSCIVSSYRSLNAIVAQSQNCPFGVNTTIELKHMLNTSDNAGTLLS